MRSTLRKTEILRGRSSFSTSISKGIVISQGPIKCFVLALPSSKSSIKAGFSMSKRMYGATARNQLKRKMREAYRQRKHLLNDVLARNTSDVQLVFLFRDAPPKSVTEKKAIDASMAKLLEDVKKIIRRM